MRLKTSIKGRLLLISVLVCICQAGFIAAGLYWLNDGISPQNVMLLVLAVLLSLLLLLFLLSHFYKPIQQLVTALETGVASFKDKDFSITVHNQHNDELGRIVDAYNDMSTTLREERMSLFQRELLLDTIIQSSPVSIILTDERGFVIYANGIAKQLFKQERQLEGLLFAELLAQLPDELRLATQEGKDGLVSMMLDHEKISWYLHCQSFVLNSSEHHLYLYKNLTTELSRQEIELWKKAIRLISHELNNSLAPISSLANSARKILSSNKQQEALPDIMDTISQRVKKLNGFLKEYAEFARLPAPKFAPCSLPEFVKYLLKITPFQLHGDVPQIRIQIDEAQLEQVFINLYQNAVETGCTSEAIHLSVNLLSDGVVFAVSDEGGGMNEQQLQQALLPFYTTKSGGSGLGLSLCNEIVIAHNGFLRLQNTSEVEREKGLEIKIILPM